MKLIPCFFFAFLSLQANPQVRKSYLQQANALVTNEQYPEALEKFIYELEDTSFNGLVRRPVALYYWKRFGVNYPPALQALQDIRDNMSARLRNCDADYKLFQDVIEINRCLYGDSESIKLYSVIVNQCASLAVQCWPLIDDILFSKKEYCIIQQVVKDAVAEYNNYESSYKSMMLTFPSEAKHMGLRQMAEDVFIRKVSHIIEFAKFFADDRSAKEIKTRALVVLDNQKIKSIELESKSDPALNQIAAPH